jgi:endonuclease/exonuclease/phosphatase (EEP) superfamily protein YafD
MTAEMAIAWAVAALVAGTIASFAGRSVWFLDALGEYRHVAVALAVALAVAAWVGAARAAAVLAAGAALANAAPILVAWRARPCAVPPGGRFLRVVTWNVHRGNADAATVLPWLEEIAPDVVALQEVAAATRDLIERLAGRFEFRTPLDPDAALQTALFSRLPLVDARTIALGGVPGSLALARLAVGGDPVTVVAVHVKPPRGAARFAIRRRQLAELAARLRDVEGALIVVGDLNATPWSSAMLALRRRVALCGAGRVIPPLRTWPACCPPAGIQIDHVLSGPGASFVGARIGPAAGSDHRALVVDVIPAPPLPVRPSSPARAA